MRQPGEVMWWLWTRLPTDAFHAAARHTQGGSAQTWTVLAVLAGFIGSAIVAWQAVETHRTTTLSQRTLESSNALAIDSARSRLDQDAPRIEVYVEQVSVLPTEPRDAPQPRDGLDGRWNLPADGARLLRVQAQVKVVNLMNDRTIHLKVKGLQDTAMRADTEVLLVPAARLPYFLVATFTLSQWAENWAAHRAGSAPPHVVQGCVIAGDDRDEGVVDTWPLHLAAWPIQPAADPGGSGDSGGSGGSGGSGSSGDSGGIWRLTVGMAGNDWFQIPIRPLRERSYWISQRRQIALPEPTHYKPR